MTYLTRSSFLGRLRRWLSTAACALVVAGQPAAVWACSACYGASDSPMAKGMNAGIFSLLGVVVVVLGSLGGFFIYLARKSATAAPPALQTTQTTL